MLFVGLPNVSPTYRAKAVMDLLLAKKRAPDKKAWLEQKGNLAVV